MRALLRVRVRSAELAGDLMCETFTQALVAVHDRDRELANPTCKPIRRRASRQST